MATVSVEEIDNMIAKNDVQLFDVRGHDEAEKGTIGRPTVIPLPEFEAAFKMADDEFKAKYGCEKPGKEDGNIVTYCLRGIRGGEARDAIIALGYTKCRTIEGGYMAYQAKHGK